MLDAGQALVIHGRAEAVTSAIMQAQEQDVVLVAGKGHEDYQLVGNRRWITPTARLSPDCWGCWHDPCLSSDWLAEVLSAEPIGADCQIVEVTTDTRKVTAGCLFVALKGERFDAHDFAADAVAAGAGALLVSKRLLVDVPQLVVQDTRLALGQLGARVRQQVPGAWWR